jgi:VanZ family protein
VSASRCALAAIFYALMMLYASTIIGPTGPHFVPIDPHDALSGLIHIPYAQNGSDQRSDWMGNLGMLVPLGFLLAGVLSPGQRLSVIGGIGAFVLCVVFVLAVKYAQLFFPPRTVSLNYVIAQSLGAAIGIVLSGALRTRLIALNLGYGRLENLRAILQIYTALVVVFFLTPLDFALNAPDLSAQLERLPESFTMISGEGRPPVVRITLILASILAMMPAGALLTLVDRGRVYIGRSTGAATWIGFCAMLGVYALTTLLISGSPSLPAVGFRTIGIALGSGLMHWLTRRNPARLRRGLGGLVPWVVPLYLLTLAAVNGLLSFHWITPDTAAADFYHLGLFPLFNYYIVSKAQAAKDIVGHVVMYAPIGVMIWLRATDNGGRAAAFVLAALLSSIVETGRFLRPGLVPDINAIPLAGAAAWAALALMPVCWRMLGAVAVGGPPPIPLQRGQRNVSAPAVGWRKNDPGRVSRQSDRSKPIGDVEDY